MNSISDISESINAESNLFENTDNIWRVQEKFDDTKGLILIRRSKDNTMANRKKTNNDLQNTTQKTNDEQTIQ